MSRGSASRSRARSPSRASERGCPLPPSRTTTAVSPRTDAGVAEPGVGIGGAGGANTRPGRGFSLCGKARELNASGAARTPDSDPLPQVARALLSGHGFHFSKAQNPLSNHQLQPVRLQGGALQSALDSGRLLADFVTEVGDHLKVVADAIF